MARFDDFTLEIIESSLVAAAEESFVAFGRTSKSPVIYEVLDYAAGLMDASGKLVAQANGVPGFLGTLDLATQDCIKKFGRDGFDPGDICIVNVPYTSGTHLNDVTLVMPVFVKKKLVAFSTIKGHWSEVGGMHFGSWTSDSTELYQEGLIFTPIKLFERGKVVPAMVEIIRANVRTPVMTLGDMEAHAAALRVGARRVEELCGKYGVNLVLDSISRIMAKGEKLTKLRLRELPHGTFHAEDSVDDDGITDTPVPVRAKITITDAEFVIDLTGSGKQARGSINSPWCATVSAARAILKSVTDPHGPANDGSFSPLKVIAEPGTIFNPTPPAPTSTYWESMGFVTDLVWKALAPHVPDRLSAGHFLSVCATIVGGVDDRTKEPFAIVEPQAGGWGGAEGKDGESGLVCSGDGETYIMSNEVIEVRHPIIVEQYSLNVQDGCGKGEFRGGFGLVKDYRIDNSNATFTASFGRSLYPCWGMKGGGSGTPNYFILYEKGKEPKKTRKVAAEALAKGDLIRLKTGGGGGYGNPLRRDPQRVLSDVIDGYLSAEQARGDYGVVIDTEGMTVGQASTERLRSEMAGSSGSAKQ
ncbi:MAG: hydantoinase B/oxoprolinase family protein [Nitrososphaerales archaeon]|nr:hydantoinase B/oxoprolinase family protein [Nitrososphaerales archaeon]